MSRKSLWTNGVAAGDRLGTFLKISIRLIESTNYSPKNGNFPVVNRGWRQWKRGAWPRPCRGRCGRSVPQHLQQKIDVVVQFRVGFAQFGDLPARVEHGGVVATAEIAPDLR